MMGKIAFCFPGQLQERPMFREGHPLREDPFFKELVEKASRQTSFDLIGFLKEREGPCDELGVKLQMTTYLLSMVHFFRLKKAGWIPDILTEHSMGIYASLAASEAISFEEGLFITESIGRLLEKEGRLHPGAMASIIGLPLEEVKRICEDLHGSNLFIANFNGGLHYVISGEVEAVEKAILLALARKALSATRLAFSVALHTPLLFPLRQEIQNILKEIRIAQPKIPILNHWTVRPLKKEEVKDFLSEEISRPVYWDRCVETLLRKGFNQFVEVGQEATLTKLIRWIDHEAEAFSAGNQIEEEDLGLRLKDARSVIRQGNLR